MNQKSLVVASVLLKKFVRRFYVAKFLCCALLRRIVGKFFLPPLGQFKSLANCPSITHVNASLKAVSSIIWSPLPNNSPNVSFLAIVVGSRASAGSCNYFGKQATITLSAGATTTTTATAAPSTTSANATTPRVRSTACTEPNRT